MGVEFSLDDLLRGLDDDVAQFWIKLAECHVGFSCGAFDDAQGTNNRSWLFFPADLEVLQGTLGLGPPVFRGVNFNRAKGVGFGAGGFGHDSSLPECCAAIAPLRARGESVDVNWTNRESSK